MDVEDKKEVFATEGKDLVAIILPNFHYGRSLETTLGQYGFDHSIVEMIEILVLEVVAVDKFPQTAGMQQLLAPLLGSAGINMNTLMGSSGGGDPWDYGGSGWNGGDFYLENGIDPNYPGQTLTREELAAAGLGTR